MSDQLLAGVSQMMIFTLRGRADEHERLDALFHDERAAAWFQQMPWDESLSRWYDARYQMGVALRTRRFDEITARFLANHPRPLVVELGAGLSTRYYRVGQNRARWIELDQPVGITVRRRLDAESPEHSFLSSSVLDFSWMDLLPATAAEDILFLTEGLLPYLELAEIQQLVRRLRERFAGATWGLDVLGHWSRKAVGKNTAPFGAPLRWSVRSERDVAALGLSLVDVWPLLREPGRRTRWYRWLSWLPIVRNAMLIIEARIPAVGPCSLHEGNHWQARSTHSSENQERQELSLEPVGANGANA